MQCKKTILKRSLIVLLLYFFAFMILLFLRSVDYTCPFKRYFNISCIGCGITRAFFALMNFQFAKAYALNPLIYVWVGAVIIASVYYIFFYGTDKK